MYYIVLWSAFDLDLIDSKISRISNAYVESLNQVTKKIASVDLDAKLKQRQ